MLNIEELKRLAEAATPGPWVIEDLLSGEVVCASTRWPIAATIRHKPKLNTIDKKQKGENTQYIAAANPAAVLELIRQMEGLEYAAEANKALLLESRQNDYHAMAWLADCRFAVGDDGKRMLPDFVEYLKALKQQRDELLAALKVTTSLLDNLRTDGDSLCDYAQCRQGSMVHVGTAIDTSRAAIAKVEDAKKTP